MAAVRGATHKQCRDDSDPNDNPAAARCNMTHHSDLFWEFRGSWSLGLKSISYGVFLFVDDCLIANLSWKNLKRPKKSNLKWP